MTKLYEDVRAAISQLFCNPKEKPRDSQMPLMQNPNPVEPPKQILLIKCNTYTRELATMLLVEYPEADGSR